MVQQIQVQNNRTPLAFLAREVNLIKIDTFDRTNNPISWLESFEAVTTANELTNARKLAVVLVYLTRIATA